MPVNLALGHVSNDFLIAALVIYSLSVVAFAGDFAFGRPRRADASARVQAAGAGRRAGRESARSAARTRRSGGRRPGPGRAGRRRRSGGTDSMPEVAVPALRAIRAGGPVGAGRRRAQPASGWWRTRAAVITRGLAVHRAPWGNMYEFVTALTCVAAIFFLFVMIRYRAWTLGVFVMGAVVVALGLAETLIYTAAGQLVPALQSYWLSIHVTAMTLATGIFFVAAVLGVVYLVVDRYARRVAAGRAGAG